MLQLKQLQTVGASLLQILPQPSQLISALQATECIAETSDMWRNEYINFILMYADMCRLAIALVQKWSQKQLIAEHQKFMSF